MAGFSKATIQREITKLVADAQHAPDKAAALDTLLAALQHLVRAVDYDFANVKDYAAMLESEMIQPKETVWLDGSSAIGIQRVAGDLWKDDSGRQFSGARRIYWK